MRTLLTILLAALAYSSPAQDTGYTNPEVQTQDTITIRTGFWGTRYSIKNRPLNNYLLADAVHASTDAKNYMDVAKSYRVASALVAFVGGAILGYQFGNHLTGSPVNLPFVYAGSALVGLSIPLSISAANYTKRAARIYNDELLGRISKMQPQLQAGFSGSGAGLALRF